MLRPWRWGLLLLLFALSWHGARAEQRIALVIGNGAYQHVLPLANPASDARIMAQALAATGFELVGGEPQIDLDRGGLEKPFASLAAGGGSLFVASSFCW